MTKTETLVCRVVAVIGYPLNFPIHFLAGFPWTDLDWLRHLNRVFLSLWRKGWK